jgi:hypothetical protein
MRNSNSYLFGLIIEKNDRTLPFSRMDTVWAAVLALALMVSTSFAPEFFTHKPLGHLQRRNLTISIVVALAILILNSSRKIVLGCALGIMTLRLALVVLIMDGHRLALAGILVACVIGAYLCLHDIESKRSF